MVTLNSPQLVFAASMATVSWFALILQYVLGLQHTELTALEYAVRFFSYFTILNNLLVASCCTCLVFFSNTRWGTFFSRPVTVTAVLLYILIVGIIYNGVLRYMVHLRGLMWLVDQLLHVVTPLGFLVYWWCFTDKAGLAWSSVFYWLLFPFVYLLYTLWHGALSGFYPYPFVNVSELGMQRVLINSIWVTMGFLGIGLLLIAIGRWQHRNRGRLKK